tara:strand:+ start:251 stop:406 length:156 start_codon:yes stop_codon:yes gene_type:complete
MEMVYGILMMYLVALVQKVQMAVMEQDKVVLTDMVQVVVMTTECLADTQLS